MIYINASRFTLIFCETKENNVPVLICFYRYRDVTDSINVEESMNVHIYPISESQRACFILIVRILMMLYRQQIVSNEKKSQRNRKNRRKGRKREMDNHILRSLSLCCSSVFFFHRNFSILIYIIFTLFFDLSR